MATPKPKANPEASPPTHAQIVISVHGAKRLLDLYKNIEAADAHFRNCQSHEFRNHVQATYQAPNISAAYAALKTLIEDSEKGD